MFLSSRHLGPNADTVVLLVMCSVLGLPTLALLWPSSASASASGDSLLPRALGRCPDEQATQVCTICEDAAPCSLF